MTTAISVIVAEDHPVFRKGLTDVLTAEASFVIVGEAADGEQALNLVRQHQPRIAVLDIEMPKISGLAVADAIRKENVLTDVVMLTMYRDSKMLQQALDIGVKGYVLKDSAVTDIVACLHMVASGRPYVSAAMTGTLLERQSNTPMAELEVVDRLTPAEHGVLRRIALGLTSVEIAADLGISPKTVENHRSHICQKLDLHGPQSLLRFALEHKSLLQ